jgi:ABC-type Fe3+ transport system substrate-binding protein
MKIFHEWLVLLLILVAASWSYAGDAKPDWQLQWKKTLEAAKKEGQVKVYISGYEAVLPNFVMDYPEIKVTAVAGAASQLGERLLSERRADKYVADIVSADTNVNYQRLYKAKTLDPIKAALMLPEVLDQLKWFEGKHAYSDPEGRYVFNYVGSASYGGVSYNTKLVDVKEFNSYWDLLNPKWKGKIGVRDIREAGPDAANARFFYYHPELGPAFMKKLFREMDVALFRDFRRGPDWLAAGKFSICFFCDVNVLKQKSLPLDTFGPKVFKEGGGLVQQFGTLALVNRAPHPNAGKVFINWLLSRKGQIALQKQTANGESPADSLRIDIPKDDVPYSVRRLAGISYLDTGKPEWLEMKPVIAMVNEALKAARKS